MKTRIFIAAFIALQSVSHLSAAVSADPTVAADAMADALRQRLTEAEDMRLQALVVGQAGEGVALLGADAERATAVRRGSRLAGTVDGVKVEVAIKAVTAFGVEIETSGGNGGVFLPGSYTPLAAPAEPPPEFLSYLESEKVPIGTLMRLVSDQAGVNISVSDPAAKKVVSIFLRNVTADSAVEEICRATGLWFRREPSGRVIRVMTMEEFSDNLNTFREEQTEMFTLLYPNVVEVANVIYGLYPDRTLVSLGEEEFDEDAEYDLSRRFRRFRVLDDNGRSSFMSMVTPQVSSSGSRSGSGNFSFLRGGATARLTQWDQLRQRARRNMAGADGALGADDAELIGEAWRSGDTNLLDRVRTQVTAANANIFVSMSRKNNMLVVRTSDVRVMDEIRAMVKKLDVPTPMVLMEVKVLELAVDDNYEASFRYSFNRGTHTVGHDGGNPANVFADVLKSGQSAYDPTFAFKAIADNITAQITLLQQDGKVNTLATPTLLVANNEVARIFSGKEYPLVSGWRQGDTVVTESGIVQGNMTVEITKEDVGTMLLITPNINADKTVTLHLMQENSAVSPEKVEIPVDGGHGETKAIEYVESRSLTGTFVAKDGMTVMAGGLVKETEKETYWRTPVLGSLPLLGWLFRGTEKVKQRTELVILIKPHVILTPMEGGKVSADLMEALSAHPAADGRDSIDVHKPVEKHDPADDFKNMIQ
jgi:general secretion pathway protein D